MPVELLVLLLVLGLIAAFVWQNKGGNFFAGFALGFLLGLIGIIIVAAVTPSKRVEPVEQRTRECPSCKSPMRRDASVCPHCQRESEPWTLHEGRWWVKRDSGDYYYDETKKEWVLFTRAVPSSAIPEA